MTANPRSLAIYERPIAPDPPSAAIGGRRERIVCLADQAGSASVVPSRFCIKRSFLPPRNVYFFE